MMRQFVILFLAACGLCAQDELRIRTIAGNGSGDQPKAAAVAEGTPMGLALAVAFDSQQRPHITTVSGGVWRIAADGRWEALWQAPSGALLFAMTVDREGNIFTADLAGAIFRIDASGQATTWDAADQPVGLALDSQGNLLIAERSKLTRRHPDGRKETVAQIAPGALAIDSQDRAYVANIDGLFRVAPDGAVTKTADGLAFAVAVCPGDRVAWTEPYRVVRDGASIAGSGERAFAGETGPAREARFVTPLALACDAAGRLAVLDAGATRLRLIE